MPPYRFNVRYETRYDFATSSDSKVRIHRPHLIGLAVNFFFHSGERIKKYPDSLPNSLDESGRKPYPERKSLGFNNILIRVDGALV